MSSVLKLLRAMASQRGGLVSGGCRLELNRDVDVLEFIDDVGTKSLIRIGLSDTDVVLPKQFDEFKANVLKGMCTGDVGDGCVNVCILAFKKYIESWSGSSIPNDFGIEFKGNGSFSMSNG